MAQDLDSAIEGADAPYGAPKSFTKILTPTATDTWHFEAAGGETLVAEVSTEVFDPVLELQNPEGEIVLSVDDPGSSSRFIAELPMAGEYKIRVRGFMDKAGGPYRLMVERFAAIPTAIGDANLFLLNDEGFNYHRVPMKKGQILTPIIEVGRVGFQFMFSPNATHSPIPEGPMIATHDGDHFIKLSGQPRTPYAFRVRESVPAPLAVGVSVAGHLESKELGVFEFAAEAGDVRQFTYDISAGAAIRYYFRSTEPDAVFSHVRNDTVLGFFPANGKGPRVIVTAQIRKAGTYQIWFWPRSNPRTDYSLSMADPIVPLAVGADLRDELPVGGSRFYRLLVAPNQLVEFHVTAPGFDPIARLYNPDGRLVESNDDDGSGLDSHIAHFARAAGGYLLQVAAVGFGGGGEFHLTVKEKRARAITVGSPIRSRLAEGGRELLTFTGEANARLILSVRAANAAVRAAVYTADGVQVGSTSSLMTMILPATGEFTIIVEAGNGSGDYRLHLIDDGE